MALTVSNTWIGNENLALNSKVDSNCSWTVSTWAPEYLVDGILTSNGEHSGFTSGQTSTDMVDYWIEDVYKRQVYARRFGWYCIL